MSNALTMEKSLPSRYQIVNLIVFIYQLDVRYRRHETGVDVARECLFRSRDGHHLSIGSHKFDVFEA